MKDYKEEEFYIKASTEEERAIISNKIEEVYS